MNKWILIFAAVVLVSGCAKARSLFGPAPAVDRNPLAANEFLGDSARGSASKVPPPPRVDPQAPDQFRVRFRTTKGDFVAEVNREWSPRGVDRFHQMVSAGYFQDIAIFRAVPGFMFQFGIHGSPEVNDDWGNATIDDDRPAGVSNVPGTLCFAKTGRPNSRSTQMFVNLGNNGALDRDGFTPFGKVIEGMEVVRQINTEYGENPKGEDIQGRFKREGNKFIMKRFPRLDIIRSVELLNQAAVR